MAKLDIHNFPTHRQLNIQVKLISGFKLSFKVVLSH